MKLRHSGTGTVVEVPDRLADQLKVVGYVPAAKPAAKRSEDDGSSDYEPVTPKRRGRPPKSRSED